MSVPASLTQRLLSIRASLAMMFFARTSADLSYLFATWLSVLRCEVIYFSDWAGSGDLERVRGRSYLQVGNGPSDLGKAFLATRVLRPFSLELPGVISDVANTRQQFKLGRRLEF